MRRAAGPSLLRARDCVGERAALAAFARFVRADIRIISLRISHKSTHLARPLWALGAGLVPVWHFPQLRLRLGLASL
jgi:hypothetical protein